MRKGKERVIDKKKTSIDVEKNYLSSNFYTQSQRREVAPLSLCIVDIKVLLGYTSKIKIFLCLCDDFKLGSMKSHDCFHVMMQVFLLIAILQTLPKSVRYAIAKLC